MTQTAVRQQPLTSSEAADAVAVGVQAAFAIAACVSDAVQTPCWLAFHVAAVLLLAWAAFERTACLLGKKQMPAQAAPWAAAAAQKSPEWLA